MRDLHGFIRLWIVMVSVGTLAGWLTACAQPGDAAGEGSSLPPSQSATYVYPPPDLQVYD
jgi:hypothetical protein